VRIGVTRLACAVENELCACLIPAIDALRDRLKTGGSPIHRAAVLAEHLDVHVHAIRMRGRCHGRWGAGWIC
jgi:hypothetical protein